MRTTKQRYASAYRDYRIARRKLRVIGYKTFASEIYKLPESVIDSFQDVYLAKYSTPAGHRGKPDSYRILYRLGERFERASLARDFDSMIAIEKLIHSVWVEYPEIWIASIVCQGQNNIRRIRGLEELHV